MKQKTLLRSIALIGVCAIILTALLPAFGAY